MKSFEFAAIWLDLLEWLEEKGFERASLKVELRDESGRATWALYTWAEGQVDLIQVNKAGGRKLIAGKDIRVSTGTESYIQNPSYSLLIPYIIILWHSQEKHLSRSHIQAYLIAAR